MDAAAQGRLVQRLREVVGERYAFDDPYEMRLYQYDASPETALPDVVVLPANGDEVARVVKICSEEGVPIVARAGASGLAGGTVPVNHGVVVSFPRMDRILEIDTDNLRAIVEPGVVNLSLSQALRPLGYYYVPDPSSQGACTIGGNVAENAGGLHCLAYGVTAQHVLGCEVVTTDGDVSISRNETKDPDAIEVLSNHIMLNLACHGNSHPKGAPPDSLPIWDSRDLPPTFALYPRESDPNTVGGTRSGQCVKASPIKPDGPPAAKHF